MIFLLFRVLDLFLVFCDYFLVFELFLLRLFDISLGIMSRVIVVNDRSLLISFEQ